MCFCFDRSQTTAPSSYDALGHTVSQPFDLPAFLAGRFPGLTLDGGLFYRWPIGIRFELGGRGPEPTIMALVRHRAVNLYEGNFGPKDNCVVIAQDWSGGLLPQRPLFAFARSQNIGLRNDPQHLDIERQTDDGELDRHTLLWVEQAARSFDYGAVFQAIGNADHAIEPSVGSRVYFCNAGTDVILHMYDDRGLDVIARQPEVLVPLYRTFNQWILDYDRERIDQVFSALAG
jgi:hypothetical protein